MGTNFVIDKLTHAKVYAICKDGQEVEISISLADNATMSISSSIDCSILNLKTEFTGITAKEVTGQQDDFDDEQSEELNTFLEQFVRSA